MHSFTAYMSILSLLINLMHPCWINKEKIFFLLLLTPNFWTVVITLQKLSISDKCCSFELPISIYQIILKKKVRIIYPHQLNWLYHSLSSPHTAVVWPLYSGSWHHPSGCCTLVVVEERFPDTIVKRFGHIRHTCLIFQSHNCFQHW